MPEEPNQGRSEVVPQRDSNHHPFAAQRARNARLRDQAEQIARAMSGPARELAIPLAVVPANTRELTPLPAASRHTFLERLEATIHRVFVAATTASVSAEGQSPPEQVEPRSPATLNASALTSVFGRSCATCLGKCCTSGGDHAFLRADTIERVRREQPALDVNGMLAVYTSYLPEHHFSGSCVYHASDGCGLPRTLRSDLCNRYECGGLTQLRNALSGRESPSAFVAAADTHVLHRMALVDASETRPIALN